MTETSYKHTIPELSKELIEILKTPSHGLQRSWLFLTYIAYDNQLTREKLKFSLSSKSDKFLIAEEFGKVKGTKHHHAIVHFSTKFNIRHLNHFDIEIDSNLIIHNHKVMHPHIFEFKKSDLSRIIHYTLKEDKDYIQRNFEKEIESHNMVYKVERIARNAISSKVRDLCHNAETMDQVRDLITERVEMPGWNIAMSIAESYMEDKRVFSSLITETDYSREEYWFPHLIQMLFDDCYLKEGVKLHRWPVILLTGGSGLGKSSGICSLGPHSYHRQSVTWQDFYFTIPPEVKFIVFDDIKPEDLEELGHNKSLLCGMANGFSLSIKFKDSHRVDVNLPSIILANEPPKWINETYWKENVLWIHLDGSMVLSENNIPHYTIKNLPTLKYSVRKGSAPASIPDFKKFTVGPYTPFTTENRVDPELENTGSQTYEPTGSEEELQKIRVENKSREQPKPKATRGKKAKK